VIPEDVQAVLAPVAAHRLRPARGSAGPVASRDLVQQLVRMVAV
jgi:MoxR-like ATPase